LCIGHRNLLSIGQSNLLSILRNRFMIYLLRVPQIQQKNSGKGFTIKGYSRLPPRYPGGNRLPKTVHQTETNSADAPVIIRQSASKITTLSIQCSSPGVASPANQNISLASSTGSPKAGVVNSIVNVFQLVVRSTLWLPTP